jgi:hypothetical protein
LLQYEVNLVPDNLSENNRCYNVREREVVSSKLKHVQVDAPVDVYITSSSNPPTEHLT